MKIEVGKTYRTRDGRKAFVFYYTGVFFEVAIADQSLTFNHHEDGGLYQYISHAVDLIAEWEDPQDDPRGDSTPDELGFYQEEHNDPKYWQKLHSNWRCIVCGDLPQGVLFQVKTVTGLVREAKLSPYSLNYKRADGSIHVFGVSPNSDLRAIAWRPIPNLPYKKDEQPQGTQTDTNTPQPKTYKLSDMWVVWEHQYDNDGELRAHLKFSYYPNKEKAKEFALSQRDNYPMNRYTVTRADATEFTEGEGL